VGAVPETGRVSAGRLFLIVDDHSRLLVDGRFYDRENARICQELLRRAITRRGVPEILYADYADPPVMPTGAQRPCSRVCQGRC
jgi:hypothetical protein